MSNAEEPNSAISVVAPRISNAICIPGHTGLEMASQNNLPGTNYTLHQMFVTVSAICTALCGLLSLVSFGSHLLWRPNVKEQRHMMRICLNPFVFSVCALCSVTIYGLGSYLDPLPRMYEVYCIASFFGLMVEIVTPNERTRKEFYVNAPRMDRRNKKQVHDKGSWRWFCVERMNISICFFALVAIAIVEMVIAGVNCRNDEEGSEAVHIIFNILTVAFTISAMTTLLRFDRRFGREFQGTKIMRKFWTIKAFVFLMVTQSFIMGVIVSANAVGPTEYMTLADFTYGIYEFMICCEALLFAMLSVWTMSAFWYYPSDTGRGNEESSRRKTAKQSSSVSVGTLIFQALVPIDLVFQCSAGIKTFFGLFKGKKRFDYTGGTGIELSERAESEANVHLMTETS